jgi:hypothetical protein
MPKKLKVEKQPLHEAMEQNPFKRDFIFETYNPINPLIQLADGTKKFYRYLNFADRVLIREKDNKFHVGKITSTSVAHKRWQYKVSTNKNHDWRKSEDFKKAY